MGQALGVPAAVPLTPYLLGSRESFERPIYDGPFVPGVSEKPIEIPIDKVGYTIGFLVEISGNAVIANAPLVPRGPGMYDLLRRAQLDMPGSGPHPIEGSGHGLKMQELFVGHASAQRLGGDWPAAPLGLQANPWDEANLIDRWGVGADFTVGTKPVVQWYTIGNIRSERDLRGMIPTGALGEKQRAVLILTPSVEAELVTVPGNLDPSALRARVWQLFRTSPIPGVEDPEEFAKKWAVTVEHQVQDIEHVGARGNAIDIDVQENAQILNHSTSIVVNDAMNIADLEHFTLEINRDKAWNQVDPKPWLKRQRDRREQPFPLGVLGFDHDAHSGDVPFMLGGLERPRGAINPFGLKRLRLILNFRSSTVLGAPNAYTVTTIRRLVRL